MRRKNVLMLLSIVLIIVSVCVFVACDDKNDNSNNGGNNNNTVDGLQNITLTEGMSVDEVKEALADVKNLTAHYASSTMISSEYGLTLYIAENGTIYVDRYYQLDDPYDMVNCRYYSANFIEEDKVYGLYVEAYGTEEELNYSWRNLAQDDEFISETENAVKNFFEMIFAEIENDSATMRIQDGKLMVDFVLDEEQTVIYTIYGFNNTTLPIEEYFPNYKTNAVEKVDEE